jgi:predicted Zn-dependent protease
MKLRLGSIRTLAPLLVLALAGAVAVPAQAQLRTSEQERQQQAAFVNSMGGVYSGPQSAYVTRIGEKMAVAGGLGGRCTFTLINSEIINAFAAPPGCSVYVTRGLLSILNTEAELAGVLGHEVGHVARKHFARQRNQQVLTGLAAVLVGAVAKSDEIGQLAGKAAQLGTLSYSRSQEYEADAFATQNLPAAGYPREGISNALAALQRQDEYAARAAGGSSSATPVWARTHPLTTARIQRAGKVAGAAVLVNGPLDVNEAAYLAAMDGLLYGDDPAQGFVRGSAFVHPGLKLAFDAPSGFRLTNGATAVGIAGPTGYRGDFTGAKLNGARLEDHARDALRSILGQAQAEIGAPQKSRINGLDAVAVTARATSQAQPVDLTVVAYDVGGESVYRFTALAPAGQTATFDPLFKSFRRITDGDAGRYGSQQLAVVTVRNGDTVETLAGRMSSSGDKAALFRMLNNLTPGEALSPGRRVKLVVEPRR